MRLSMNIYDGDLPGHPYRGNQWSGGLGAGSITKTSRVWSKAEAQSLIDRASKLRDKIKALKDKGQHEKAKLLSEKIKAAKTLLSSAQHAAPVELASVVARGADKPSLPLVNKFLNASQKDAVRYYSATGYTYINKELREGKPAYENIGIVALDSAFEKKESLVKESITVYRGITKDDLKKMAGGKIKEGMIIKDKAFVSTSKSKEVATNWTEEVVLNIKVPKGARALNFGGLGVATEKEVLLQRGSEFKVRSVNKVDDVLHVMVDHVK